MNVGVSSSTTYKSLLTRLFDSLWEVNELICPECETIFVGDVEKCTVCGYDFRSE